MNNVETTSGSNVTSRLSQSGEAQQRPQPSRSVQNLILLFGLDTHLNSQSEAPQEGRS